MRRLPLALVGVLVVGGAIFYTGPLPLAFDIVTQPESAGLRYYWRSAGIGGIFGDNPWVYAAGRDGKVVASIWADTPCDGVNRLSETLSLPALKCVD